jgi:quercetin dioxygenase-like cupin family protein
MNSTVKNIPMSEAISLSGLVDIEPGKIISRTFVQRPEVSITLFSFGAGEGVSTHSAPGDAIVQILEGEAKITIGGSPLTAKTGDIVVMPANIPHAVDAEKDFKMLLTVVNK